ncbi:hypothetical protein [Clostridium paridis]|uniref:Uncharacterized protein n=1 Tax=Clostridium paridis TaxID=2803863 RepID=A0A937FHT3_9CLOT|nr:hypothetical protein [Clostridium paridis]MBL4932272.1 hypothetical protein [Clostridium paridis]
MKIGFDVEQWTNKPLNEFTNEQLIEYYYKLRLQSKQKELSVDSPMVDFYVIDLQKEIIKRMIRR